MTQFNMSEYKVLDMSYNKFLMYLNTTPMPDTDFDDENNTSDIKPTITGKTTMMDYYNR